MRILVVDDEIKLALYLQRGLAEAGGYVVDVAHTGEAGLALALERVYDLVVLDVMLPDIDGFVLLARLRAQRQMPVLMLTARDSVGDRVRGLHSGADDYLVKPFSFSELAARVHALLRRQGRTGAEGVAAAGEIDIRLDPVRRRAYREGREIALTAQECALLRLLLQHQGVVLSRTAIAERLWNIQADSEVNVIEVAMRRLRLKLDAPFATKILHTVRGRGYVLEERAAELPADEPPHAAGPSA